MPNRKLASHSLEFLILILIGILVLIPIGLILFQSFWSAEFGYAGELSGEHYSSLTSNPSIPKMMRNTLILVISQTTLAIIFGVGLAWLVARTNVPLKGFIEKALVAGFIIPGFGVAIGWAMLGAPETGLLNNWLPIQINMFSIEGMIWVGSISYTPIAFLMTLPMFKSMNIELEEASYVLSGSRIRTFFRITLPLAAPSIFSSVIIVGILAVEDFVIPMILGLPGRVFVMTSQIYTSLYSSPPNIGGASSLSMLLVAATMIGLFIQRTYLSKKQFTTITGKGMKPSTIDLGRFKYVGLLLAILYLLNSIVLPFIPLIITAFVKVYTPWVTFADFTLVNFYRIFFERGDALRALSNTIILGVLAATLAVFIGIAVAQIVYKGTSGRHRVLDYFSIMSIGIPGIVLAIGMLWLWIALPINVYGTRWIILMAYIVRFMPYSVRAISGNTQQIHKELEEASSVLGGSWFRTFRNITFPLLKPSILSSWAFVFILTSRELVASAILSSPGNEVLSVFILDLWWYWGLNELAVLALIQAALIAGVYLIFRRISKAGISLS